jgi:hypothetical protein
VGGQSKTPIAASIVYASMVSPNCKSIQEEESQIWYLLLHILVSMVDEFFRILKNLTIFLET